MGSKDTASPLQSQGSPVAKKEKRNKSLETPVHSPHRAACASIQDATCYEWKVRIVDMSVVFSRKMR